MYTTKEEEEKKKEISDWLLLESDPLHPSLQIL
jgi:hypothetical protein